jgi:hypothetical protein
MYFATSEFQRSPDEIYAKSVDYMQTYFQADQSCFELPWVFGAIEAIHPDDDDLANFALDFDINSRVVAALQAETYNRRSAAKTIANSLADEKSFFQSEVIERASRAGSSTHPPQPKNPGYGVMRTFDLNEFKPRGFGRTKLTPYPPDMDRDDWRQLSNCTYGTIIRGVAERTRQKGDDYLELRLASTAVRLVCSREVAQSHVLIATAPSRVNTAHHVLQAIGNRYDRGVALVSGALNRGNHIDEWDIWQDLSAQAVQNPDAPDRLSNEYQQMLLEDGMALAVRNHRPDVALNIIEDIFNPETYDTDYQPSNNTLCRAARALAILAMQNSEHVQLT